MTWVDGAVLAVLAVSAILAYLRGFVREALGVGAWVGATLAALLARPYLSPHFLEVAESPWLADALAVAAAFLAVLVVLKVLIAFVANKVQASVLGGVDRALGLAFGAARGAFLVVVAYVLGGLVLPGGPPGRGQPGAPGLVPGLTQWPAAVRDAHVTPWAAEGAARLTALLPETYRPRLAPAPPRTGPTLEDLMRPPARNRT